MARPKSALSRERIVAAAIEILDAGGEPTLTFRALAARLDTGAGAIYWHLENKDALLAAATSAIVDAATLAPGKPRTPSAAIRALALHLFDAIDAHPWVGAQLSRAPWETAMMQIFERIGGQLVALEVPSRAQFFTASALVNYILGVAGQNAANARDPAHDGDRDAHLAAMAARWAALEPTQYPFVRRMAKELAGHDDRAQFLAGVDLILAGLGAR